MYEYIVINPNSGEIIATSDFKHLFSLVRIEARYQAETSEMWVFFGSKCEPICTIHSATKDKPMHIVKGRTYPLFFKEGHIAIETAKAYFDMATDTYR